MVWNNSESFIVRVYGPHPKAFGSLPYHLYKRKRPLKAFFFLVIRIHSLVRSINQATFSMLDTSSGVFTSSSPGSSNTDSLC